MSETGTAAELKNALTEGHIEAAKRIADSWIVYNGVKTILSDTRKTFSERLTEANTRMRASIERMGADDSSLEDVANEVLSTYQEVLEIEAERKMKLHELLSECKEAEQDMNDAANSWSQLELPI